MVELLKYAFKKFVDYLTRILTIPRVLLGAAVTIAVASIGLSFTLNLQSGVNSFSFSSDDAGANTIGAWGLALAVMLFAVSIIWAIVDQVIAHRRDSKRTTIVIESRGLRDENGVSLATAVKKAVKGQVEEMVLDLRRFMRDGQVVDAQGAANEISRLPGDLKRRRELKGRDDTSIIYGGLTPVPFTFYTGVLLDDEGMLQSYDWDRVADRWRALDEEDDKSRFRTSFPAKEDWGDSVVLAISCSYPILDDNLERSFPGVPVVRMDLMGQTKESHWSSAKQSALAMQVLDVATTLEGRGVKTVHLVLAAANSFVFQIGRKWDRRNVPRGTVYQFERDGDPPFAWGLVLPQPGIESAEIRRSQPTGV
jgi:hypothetical protein